MFALGILALAVLAHVTEGAAAAQKCFVCAPHAGGGSADDLLDMFPGETPPGCEHFRVDEPRFERACPAEYKGCLTITNGTHVTRTCSAHAVDDCKIANGIKYCYCGHPLCNRGVEPARQGVVPDDDEDLSPAEGSGAGGSSGGYRPREPPGGATTPATPPGAHATPAPAPPRATSAAGGRTVVAGAWGMLVVVVVAALCSGV